MGDCGICKRVQQYLHITVLVPSLLTSDTGRCWLLQAAADCGACPACMETTTSSSEEAALGPAASTSGFPAVFAVRLTSGYAGQD